MGPFRAPTVTIVKHLLAIDRIDEIRRRLEIAGSVSVADLAASLGVSRETVRRDLKQLAERGDLEIVHGGATRVRVAEPALAARSAEHFEAKTRIAKRAAALVSPGSTVLVDSGSTTIALARELAKAPRLTVATNSLAVATLMSRGGHRVHMLGGEIDDNDESTMSHETIEALRRFRFDIAFVAAGGLSVDGGATDYTPTGAAFRAELVRAARRAILLADSSKFGLATPFPIDGLDQISALVTDRRPPRELAGMLADAGLELIIAR